MKTPRILAVLMVICMLLLTGCGCEHEWKDATCEEPKTCLLCDETKGDALGHEWEDATCEEPKTCSVCDKTEGDVASHTPGNTFATIDAVTATISHYNVCSVCEEESLMDETALDTYIDYNDRFLFSAEEFMDRLLYLTKGAYGNVEYEMVAADTGLQAYLYADEEMVLIQFFNDSMESLGEDDIKETGIMQAVSLAVYGDEDTDLPYYFYMATDPLLDMDAAKALNDEIGAALASSMLAGEPAAYHEDANLLYEAAYYPAGTLVQDLSISMINIYSEDFR